MNNFQTILVAIFLAFFVFGVMIFSGLIDFGSKTKSSNISGKIIVWGTLPSSQISELFFNNLPGSGDAFNVEYVEKKASELEQNLVEAYAIDKGPDLFILPSDMVLQNNNFILKVPYTSFSEKTFRNSFIDGTDIYLSKDGILGFPLLVDPLVLYYNKDMLSNESILYPPSTWDELFGLNSKLTKKDKDGKITASMIALGQYDNVSHVKDILSMFLLQSNNPIIIPIDKGYRLALKDATTNGVSPINQIINFFLEFSNPSNEAYSWNRSQPNSFDMFTSGKLAFYVGYASELFKIESVNPNLSYDVTMIPQTKGSNLKRTYGNIYTIFISSKSKNITSSSGVASLIKDPLFLKELGIATSLPTATRSLLADKPADPYMATFFEGAIISRSWFDPDNKQTDQIFKELIENSLSNRLSVGSAIDKASNQINLLLKKIYE